MEPSFERPSPLSAPELSAALARCVAADDTAALVLALPVGEPALARCHRSAGAWRWRGDSEPCGTDPVEALAALVARNAVPADRFCDPAAPPWHWVRPVRSGASVHLVGATSVLGAPAMVAEPGLGRRELLDVLAAWYGGDVEDPPSVVHSGTTTVLVDGDDACWRLRAGHRSHATPEVVPGTAGRLAALADDLAASAGSEVSCQDLGDGSYLLSARPTGTGLVLELPVVLDGAMTEVGVDRSTLDDAGAADLAGLPHGWVVVGTSSGCPVVAGPAGQVALVRPVA